MNLVYCASSDFDLMPEFEGMRRPSQTNPNFRRRHHEAVYLQIIPKKDVLADYQGDQAAFFLQRTEARGFWVDMLSTPELFMNDPEQIRPVLKKITTGEYRRGQFYNGVNIRAVNFIEQFTGTTRYREAAEEINAMLLSVRHEPEFNPFQNAPDFTQNDYVKELDRKPHLSRCGRSL